MNTAQQTIAAVFLGTLVLGFVAILDISASDVLGIGSRAGLYALMCVGHALGDNPDDDHDWIR